MAFKLIILATCLVYASAGIIGAPAAIATYSAAPAVSSAYIHRSSPAIAVAHAAPVVQSYAAAPIVQSYATAPVAVHAPAIGASQQNVYRSLGGAQSVSTYSKAVDSAFSTVRKYDTRITNDALTAAPVAAYAAPAYSAYSAPAYSAYSAPAYSVQAAPFISNSIGPVASYATPAISTYNSPLLAKSVAPGPVIAKAGLAYSPATVVAHTTFTGLGANYAW